MNIKNEELNSTLRKTIYRIDPHEAGRLATRWMKTVCHIFRAVFLLAAIVPIITVGCGTLEKDTGTMFRATVLEKNQTSLLVEPEQGSAELRSADRITVYISDANLFDAQGQEITVDEIEAGSLVNIYYSGAIAESYPAQIHGCYKITVKQD